MSEPQEQEPAKPRGKVSAFFHEHGGLLAAGAGLVAAIITVIVVTRGSGGGSTTPVSSTPAATDGTGVTSGGTGGSSPNADLSTLSNQIGGLTSLITTENTSLQGILQRLPGGVGAGVPVTPPTVASGSRGAPQPALPVNTSGHQQFHPVTPTSMQVPVKMIQDPITLQKTHQAGTKEG